MNSFVVLLLAPSQVLRRYNPGGIPMMFNVCDKAPFGIIEVRII
jgi:hypothetical protein